MANFRFVDDVAHNFHAVLSQFDENRVNFRLWAKDATLFTNTSEAQFLDWLNEPQALMHTLSSLIIIRDEQRAHSFDTVVLLGMGGSSLSPTVFKQVLAPDACFFVLDTIHPHALARLLARIDLSRTLFIVASKSGSTLEPLLLYQFFLQKLLMARVADPYAHFMAITDPVTPLEQEASENGFLRGPFGKPGIGGRFSGLSAFGLMPALLMNIDIERLLSRAIGMTHECGPSIPARDNPAACLAAFFAASFHDGRDKIIFHFAPHLESLGLWLEQLIAESLGKKETGLIPLIGEHHNFDLNTTMHVFVGVTSKDNIASVADTLAASIPVYFIETNDPYDVAGLMFLFQMATALFASVIKINPFDQPDVEDSKRCTKAVLKQLENNETIVVDKPVSALAHVNFYNDAQQFFADIQPGDYGAILAYVDENADNTAALRSLKTLIEQKTHIPIMLQFGPRYLHSTGQLFKGGKNSGHFLVVTGDYDQDFPSGNTNLTLSQIHFGQALGDIAALKQKHRRILHAHVSDLCAGVRDLMTFIDAL